MHFCQIFGLSKLLTGRENGSQKGITEREFGSQNHLPDENLAIKYHYRTIFHVCEVPPYESPGRYCQDLVKT